jgi:hypothetical protein
MTFDYKIGVAGKNLHDASKYKVTISALSLLKLMTINKTLKGIYIY